MSDTFPGGPGVTQGPVDPHPAPAGEGSPDPVNVIRPANKPPIPWPTDDGGTDNQGWMKAQDYGDGYYGGDGPGPWKQT